MTTRKFSVHIQRPIDEVFQYSTNPEHLPEWGDGIKGARVTSEGAFGVGSTFAIQNSIREGMEFVNKVVKLEPNQQFSFHTAGRMLTYTATRTYSEKAGGTEVTETLDIEPPKGIFLLLHPVTAGMAARMHHKSLENLKNLMEK